MKLKTDPSHPFRSESPSLQHQHIVRNGSKSPELTRPSKAKQKANIAQFSPQHQKNPVSQRRKLKSHKPFKQMDQLLNQDINHESEHDQNINRSSQLAVNGFGKDSTGRHMHKNKSELLQHRRKNNKLVLQKLRSNQKPINNARYNRIEEEQPSGVYLQNQQYGDDNLKQRPRHHQSSQLIKSRSKINSLKHNTNNNSLITLSTIKQKIQRYLAEEQSKLKHLKNTNTSSPHKHVLHEKANIKLKITEQNYQPSPKPEDGIFASLSSLTRKKETKFALDMMKRRLNFSVVNRSIKERQAVNYRQKPYPFNSKRVSLNEEEVKKEVIVSREHLHTQMHSGVASNVQSTLENEPQQWQQLKKEIVKNLSFKLSNVSGGKSQQMPNSYYQIPSIPLINPIPTQGQSNSKQTLPKEQTKKSLPKQTKNKQYLYNLYYNPNSHSGKESHNPLKSSQQQESEKVQRYKDWKKHNITQDNLKELLKQHTDPVDPIQCYYDAFLKPSSLESIKPIPSNKKQDPRSILYNSNSPSRSPLGKYKYLTQHNKSKHAAGNQKIDQKIIFVTKKEKHNLQNKKLYNLLSKIEKRNSQIERIGCIQAVEMIKSPKNHKGRKINGLNIQEYIEENLTLIKPKEDKNSHNFIVQWPKKQEVKEKQLVVKKSLKRKENPEDWTEFEPWMNGTVNENELEGPFKKASERKSHHHAQKIGASQ